ncbi:hypothetical protein O3G_MSEX009676 [Manduca sexta]|uniref:MYND-type domain-containing protein n=1 Tax=Manduca sexta TaxID=7130 RepID=A0A922CS32_MANSE|nr:hypothetical protein O3G_MSEX009676 [Manduca sexta]
MSNIELPDDCAKQWEILLLLISAEEKKIDRTSDGEIDTMNYFFKNEGIRRILLQWLQQMKQSYAKKMSETDTALKSDEVALLWRQKGNDKFRANRLEDSYRCYMKSVLYAPQDGPMYPLALANRSAALLRMKRFQECLSDIKLALASGYPNEQRHKLLLRRADCHIELGQRTKALEALNASSQHAASLKLSAAQCAEFERHIRDLERKVEVIVEEEKVEDGVIPECYKGLNENFHAASNAIELRRNDTAGRHVVTCHATRRGDVLFSEEPYACVTLPTGTDSAVCDNCCKSSVNIVPCSACSRSVYCGAECRSRASAVFHRWECVGAQADLFPTVGIAHLALRVLLVSASDGFPKVPTTEPEPRTAEQLFNSYSRVDSVQIYKHDTPAFYRMFNLVTNFDKMNNADYIQYALAQRCITVTGRTARVTSQRTDAHNYARSTCSRATVPRVRTQRGGTLCRCSPRTRASRARARCCGADAAPTASSARPTSSSPRRLLQSRGRTNSWRKLNVPPPPEERCEKALASFKLKQQVLHRHHTALRTTADRLARIYADVGEFSKSVELIKQNIQSLEYQFGSFSVEVAHELRKLSDVMLERLVNSPQHPDCREWCLEAHKIIKKAVQLMELNYGSWEPLVKRLREHEAVVASMLAHSRTPETANNIHHNLHYNLKI